MDKELEIKRQFLDEAQDYLDDLDQAFFGIADQKVDAGKINAALRAAHSIKGGAGMMQFMVLSDLAHRIEDSLKVLKHQSSKNQRDSIFDGNLETLALNAVNAMRQVVNRDRISLVDGQLMPIDSPWLKNSVMPLFDQLRDRLGAPEDDDAAAMLSSDEGQEIIPMIFETEVEGCLQRLETVLSDPQQPCLREEVTILAQELGGLGEMLQLAEFSQLCESVLNAASSCAEESVCATAITALDAWRTTQKLVLSGQFTNLPTQIDCAAVEANLAATQSWGDFNDDLEDSFSWDDAIAAAEAELTVEKFAVQEFAVQELQTAVVPDLIMPDLIMPDNPAVQASNSPANLPTNSFVDVMPDLTERSPSKPSPDLADEDATVRVSVRQLNQLNDLFGELAIERNGLDLYFKRLNGLMRLLGERVKQLDQTNIEVRNLYDRSSNNAGSSSASSGAWDRSRAVDPFNTVAGADLRTPSTNIRLGSFVEPKDIEANGNDLATIATEFDDLELDRYGELHSLSQQIMETVVQIQEVTSDLNLSIDDAGQTTRNLNKTAKQLQTRLTQLRMRPLADVTDRFPRLLRDLALQHGKKVRLQVTGGNLLIDRNILESLQDPLMHLIRNAFDHGIESPEKRRENRKPEEGVIEIKAVNRGNRTEILIQDDGNGIPLNKIRSRAEQMGLDAGLLSTASEADLLSLIFEPGFSTSDSVTTLSGRGVGMDIVRDNLKQIRGEISVNTQAGLGTTFKLSLPYTLSIVRIILAESQGMLLGLPNDAIDAVKLFEPETVHMINDREYITHQNESIPLLRLNKWLHFNCARQPQSLETPASLNAPTLLVTQLGNQKEALLVDRCWGEQEVAVRRIEAPLSLPAGFSGCTILGDGRIVPLVNVNELLQGMSSYASAADLQLIPESNLNLPLKSSTRKSTILIVDDSINVRRYLALTLERAGYRVEQAKDGQDAIEKLEAGLMPNAMICDIEMPRLDGFGVLNRLRSNPQLKHIPIALLTSRSGEKHRRLAESLGANAYFTKPYSEQDLLTTLEQMVNLIPA